jgi:hypothetical protein
MTKSSCSRELFLNVRNENQQGPYRCMDTISPRIIAADFAVFHVLKRGLYGELASPLEYCDGNWQMLTSFVSAIAAVYSVALT